MLRVRKFATVIELEHFLQGGVVGGEVPRDNRYYGLIGLDLVFTAPAAFTVTFVAGAAGAQGGLSFKEVHDQIEAVNAGIRVLQLSSPARIAIRQKVPATGAGGGVSFTGTARAALGFGANNTIVGKVYGPPFGTPTAPYVVALSSDANQHVIVTEE